MKSVPIKEQRRHMDFVQSRHPRLLRVCSRGSKRSACKAGLRLLVSRCCDSTTRYLFLAFYVYSLNAYFTYVAWFTFSRSCPKPFRTCVFQSLAKGYLGFLRDFYRSVTLPVACTCEVDCIISPPSVSCIGEIDCSQLRQSFWTVVNYDRAFGL